MKRIYAIILCLLIIAALLMVKIKLVPAILNYKNEVQQTEKIQTQKENQESIKKEKVKNKKRKTEENIPKVKNKDEKDEKTTKVLMRPLSSRQVK